MTDRAETIDDLLEDWFNAQYALRRSSIAGVPLDGVRPSTWARIYNRATDTRQALAEALAEALANER